MARLQQQGWQIGLREEATTGRKGLTAYRRDLEFTLLDFCTKALMAHVAHEKIHHCHTAVF